MNRKDLELRKMPNARGGFEIWVAGEHWADASPRWAGVHGLSHNLEYPSGLDIMETTPSPTKGDPHRMYEYKARVESYRTRARKDFRVPVEDQAEAVKTKFLALVAAGRIKSPADRAAEAATRKEKDMQHRAAEQARRDRIQLGFSRLWGFALTDDERFALDEIYYEAFAVRYSQR